MISQRDNDISRLEAQVFVTQLYKDWLLDFLGARAEQPQPNAQGTEIPNAGPAAAANPELGAV